MLKILKNRFKLYKRENINLFLKNRKYTPKKFKKFKNTLNFNEVIYSHFNYQIKEKQKIKIIYGVLEKQFSKYFILSKRIGGDLSWNIICLLESRLDNVVYRLGFSSTRRESKQIIRHKCILVNNKKVNISSYLLKIGDIIKLSLNCRKQKRIRESLSYLKKKFNDNWLFMDFKNLVGYLKRYPKKDEIDYTVDEKLIFDFYRK